MSTLNSNRGRSPFVVALAIGATAALGLTGLFAAAPAWAASTICVGGAGCYSTVQAAVDAAPAGGVVRVAAGTYAGGIRIGKSLTLVGAGSSRTTLKGGNHVIWVTSPDGSAPPSVTISDLTLTGGVARGGSDESYSAFGGGLLVDGQEDGDLGATVVLRSAVVEGNLAEAASTTTFDGYDCPGGLCPFAISGGGGVASFGTLTIDHSVIRNNAATGQVSDADGGGVFTGRGALTVLSTTITGNRTEPKTIGRFAEGGGLFAGDLDESHPTVPIVIRNSVVNNNASVLNTSWPVHPSPGSDEVIDMNANAGGVHIGGGYTATIDRTTIDHNAVVAVDPTGEPYAIDGGLIEAGTGFMTLTHSSVSQNSTQVVAATADDVGPSGTALEVDGTVKLADSSICGNTTDATAAAGSAQDSDGLAVLAIDGSPGVADLQRMVITGNTATATTSTGTAFVFGAGVLNNSVLTMTDTAVTKNRGKAVSPGGVAQGGGVWTGALISGPPVSFTAHRALITGNAVTAPGGTATGGGVYNGGGDGVTFSLDHTAVLGNAPDQIADQSSASATPAKQSLAKKKAGAPSRFRSHAPRY